MKITIVGAGNMAYHLTHALVRQGHEIERVITRSDRHFQGNFSFSQALDHSDLTSSAVILAVSDRSISEVLREYTFPKNTTLAHTSGSVSLKTFKSSQYKNTGCLYPLQTFSLKKPPVDFSAIPIFIEGSNKTASEVLMSLAYTLSSRVSFADSTRRLKIHLAAVLANNFVNHLLRLSEEILEREQLDLEILKPLLFETLDKALTIGPTSSQTGPAARRDFQSMEKHMEHIHSAELRDLYQLLSQQISDFTGHKN